MCEEHLKDLLCIHLQDKNETKRRPANQYGKEGREKVKQGRLKGRSRNRTCDLLEYIALFNLLLFFIEFIDIGVARGLGLR